MNKSPTILTSRLILRKPMIEDINDRFSSGSTRDWVRMLGGDTRSIKPFTIQDAQKWYDKLMANPLEWSVVYNGICIGQARLTVNYDDKRARYAVGIFDHLHINVGLGTEITNAVLDFAFNNLKLHRVDLRVLEYNVRAIACYKKCGFVIEGKEREGALVEGKWESDLMMSILEGEYKAKAI